MYDLTQSLQMDRRTLLGTGAALGLTALLSACGDVKTGSGGGGDGDFPTGAMQVSVGFAAGGSTDLIARAMADQLTKVLGQPMPVINTPGANGVVAAKELMSAKPDGYSLGCVNASSLMVTPFAVGPDEQLETDDLRFVKGFTADDWVLVTHPENGWKTLQDVKAAGKEITYGTTSFGSGAHMCAAIAFGELGISAKDVPFEGDAPTQTAVLGKQVDVSANQLAAVYENVKAGKLLPLIIFSDKKNDNVPEVKTAKEQGIDFAMAQWRVLAAPKDTPDDVVKILAEACDDGLNTDAFKEFCKNQTLVHELWEPDEITKKIKDAKALNEKKLKEFNISFKK